MKIVIIGDGKVGHILAKQLSEQDYDVVIIDNNTSALKKSINDLDINCVEGNGVDSDILLEAGVSESDLVIACTSTDEVNMICCLLSKKLGAKQTIARVRNPVYYKQMELLKEDLCLSMAVNPEFATAEEIARVLIFPAAAKVETFVKGRVELVEVKIDQGNAIAGLSLAELYKKYQVKFLICAVQRGQDNVTIPDGNFVLQAGDKINIAASHSEIKRFFKILGTYRNKVKSIMICGGSRTAYYLAEKMISLGMMVKIIEKDEKRCHELSEMLPKATIILGDAADHELLNEEGLSHMDAVLALTGIDEENIIMSLYAKSKQVPKIITKVNSESLNHITDQLGLDSVVSPKQITADFIISYVRAMQNSLRSANVETLYQLIESQIEALEFIIRSPSYYLNTPLRDLTLKSNILIACIVRNRNIIIPGGNDVLKVGDSVIIITKNRSIQDLEDILSQENRYE